MFVQVRSLFWNLSLVDAVGEIETETETKAGVGVGVEAELEEASGEIPLGSIQLRRLPKVGAASLFKSARASVEQVGLAWLGSSRV